MLSLTSRLNIQTWPSLFAAVNFNLKPASTKSEVAKFTAFPFQTNGFNTMMTRADFWAISTVATVDAGIKTANFKAGCTVRGEGGEL